MPTAISRCFVQESTNRTFLFGVAFFALFLWTPPAYLGELTGELTMQNSNSELAAYSKKGQNTTSSTFAAQQSFTQNTTNPIFASNRDEATQANAHKQEIVLRSSEIPDASNWIGTDDTPFEVCFLTSVYSSSVQTADHPPSVQEIKDNNPTFQFFAFTNLPDLDAPGWTVIVKNFSQYRRFITQSRWPKFLAWKHELVHGCQAVFYMDGFCSPKLKHSERYKRLAKAIHDSEFGLFQNQHDMTNIGPLDELDRIVEKKKDIPKNVEASKAWLLSQPDFRPNSTMYANHYMGYNPKSSHFQTASQFFWDHYSLEQDSWRDQPLWTYVLDKFHITPTRLGTFEALFREYWKRTGHGGHRYDEKTDSNALKSAF
jgi:hypothetical protein